MMTSNIIQEAAELQGVLIRTQNPAYATGYLIGLIQTLPSELNLTAKQRVIFSETLRRLSSRLSEK